MKYSYLFKAAGIASIVLVLIGGFVWLGTRIDPTVIVERLGVQNSIIILFIVSFFGGFSTGGAAVFLTVLITLVAGGMNPWLAGMISGTSLFIGDAIMFLFARKGRGYVTGTLDKSLKSIALWIKQTKVAQALTPVLAYLYIGFSPLPNDLLIFFLASIQYPKKLTLIILFLGDYTFATFIALLTAYGITVL